MSVARAQREVSHREFLEWQIFERIEPFGEHRADLRAAMNACVMANAWKGKGAKTFTIDDFMLTFEEKEPRAVGTKELRAKLRAYIAGFAGR